MAILRSSTAALDLIWQEETGGHDYYTHTNAHRAQWPGVNSGVTIGGFYDLGYVSEEEFRRDWGDKLPGSMLAPLESVIGIHGRPAASHAREIAPNIDVPFDVARDVFLNREIPKWEKVVAALPNADSLPADCFGALVSIAMNRGDHFRQAGDRYREMRLIRFDLDKHYLNDIPDLIRRMKRIWPFTDALRDRRDKEAALFQRGLDGAA